MSPILTKIQQFTEQLDRTDFYAFYTLMTALAGPVCGDYIIVSGKLINLKRIVRRLRITVMAPRFQVDYAKAYTSEEITEELTHLTMIFPYLTRLDERQGVSKLIEALKVLQAE